jgi:pyridoxal/pyridoxine/pyridoxamine kinase
MNSKKSPHESSLQVISRIETETYPVFSDLSVSDIFYVERCLDEKIQSLAIDPTFVDLEQLATEIEQFKDQKIATEAAIATCKLFEQELLEQSRRIEENEQNLKDLKKKQKELEILNSVKEVMIMMPNNRFKMDLVSLMRKAVPEISWVRQRF